MRISDWSSDVCSSDLHQAGGVIDIEYIIIRDRDHHGTRKDGQKSRGDAGHQRSLVDLPQHQVKAPGNDAPTAGDDGPPERHHAPTPPSAPQPAPSDDKQPHQPDPPDRKKPNPHTP